LCWNDRRKQTKTAVQAFISPPLSVGNGLSSPKEEQRARNFPRTLDGGDEGPDAGCASSTSAIFVLLAAANWNF
jgi:hypothetical protein